MNLIVTCPRNFEDDACDELAGIFEQNGFDRPSTEVTSMPGIIIVQTGTNPTVITRKIREIVNDEPWAVRYIQRMIPISMEVPCRMHDITRAAEILSKVIGDADTYRITVEKRHTALSGSQIISNIAGMISRKVCLEDPDWLVLVEIIGARVGVSVIRPSDILSVQKTKRKITE